MRVDNTTFYFAGHEKVAQEQKTVKSAIPKLAEQPIKVSISKWIEISYIFDFF